MKPRSWTFVEILVLFLTGCRILDLTPMEINGFFPRNSVVEKIPSSVWIAFSFVPDYTLAEEAFSLASQNRRMEGRFHWSGKKLEFFPYTAIESGMDYVMKVASSVENSEGHSLRREFVHKFSTRREMDSPQILNVLPREGSLENTRAPLIRVRFSEPMNPGLVADSFQLFPDAGGFMEWDEKGMEFTYRLTENLAWQKRYKIVLSESAADRNNNKLRAPWNSSFFVGKESDPPRILRLSGHQGGITAAADKIASGWESHWPLVFNFSEAMNRENPEKSMAISPEVVFSTEWNSNGQTLTLTPQKNLEWGKVYFVHVKKTLKDLNGNPLKTDLRYGIRVDGKSSRPPSVAGMIVYTNPADAGDFFSAKPYASLSLSKFSSPPGEIRGGNSVVDLFLNTAKGARPDTVRLMEHLTISGRGVKQFLPLSAAVKDNTFNPSNVGTGSFGPSNPGVEYNTYIRLIVFIDNSDSFGSGVLTFKIGKQFADTGGRTMKEDWIMPVILTD